jgi:UDP-glucose 4-epimerase
LEERVKAIVTGGLGFIGSHVVDALMSDGHEVLVVDNFYSGRDRWAQAALRPEISNLDIRNRAEVVSTFRNWQPSVVFHMAAHHFIPFCESNPVEAHDLNVGGTLNVLVASFHCQSERFFFASTADVYAPSPKAHREDDPVAPFSVYGRTKAIAEQLCRSALDWGWNTNILVGRLFNAVGKRETNPHLIPDIVKQIAAGVDELRLGNLFPTRDFVDVESQARAIVDGTLRVRGIETVNVGSGVSISVREMVDLMIRVSARSVKVSSDPLKTRASERNNLCADTNRLKMLIGYAPAPANEESIQGILAEADVSTSVSCK